MTEIIQLKTIAELHRFFGVDKPLHPLISISWHKADQKFDFGEIRVTSDLYQISMKGDMRGAFTYGRNSYDFEEGTLVFTAPGQVASFRQSDFELSNSGWSLTFHPDLIRKSELGRTIKDYSFFDYAVHEALHVSEKESNILTDLVKKVEIELQQNIDDHSQDLMIVIISAILKYCRRYYNRQFHTRTNLNKDLIVRFEQYLETYFASNDLLERGLPTVTQCGEALNMTGSYLSDLLKLETGKSALTYIHAYVIEEAKTLLLNTNDSVGEVAYRLGFQYQQHFSKLFKAKTGVSPSDFRNTN
jgi:AraC-like DNA-binding protein